jgi:hypothetical protein
VFFYYSGHARATAIDLGPEALPLAELRQKLFSANATLTVVVLDACQSGAFSRVKGAQPTADFSFNSRQQLDSKGVAVLASSTGSELSQESEQLKSSYFTHHLLVGMRGAGDANNDGQVSVDEAYRYAYHQTLLATSVTAVGGQHVTLEVDLKGHGEVALSYPKAATASIELPAALEGKAMVMNRRAKTVVAETHKAKGKAVRIAVAPGDYEVTVRQGDRVLRCGVIAPGWVDLSRCTNERYVDATRKGGGWKPKWEISASFMLGDETSPPTSSLEDRLVDFGYRQGGGVASAIGISTNLPFIYSRQLPGMGVGLVAEYRTTPGWERSTERSPLRFGWSTTVLGVTGSFGFRLGATSRFFLSTELMLGLGIGRTHFDDQDDRRTVETHFGPVFDFTFGAGVLRLFGNPRLAMSINWKNSIARVITNDIGDTHDALGGYLGTTLHFIPGGLP